MLKLKHFKISTSYKEHSSSTVSNVAVDLNYLNCDSCSAHNVYATPRAAIRVETMTASGHGESTKLRKHKVRSVYNALATVKHAVALGTYGFKQDKRAFRHDTALDKTLKSAYSAANALTYNADAISTSDAIFSAGSISNAAHIAKATISSNEAVTFKEDHDPLSVENYDAINGYKATNDSNVTNSFDTTHGSNATNDFDSANDSNAAHDDACLCLTVGDDYSELFDKSLVSDKSCNPYKAHGDNIGFVSQVSHVSHVSNVTHVSHVSHASHDYHLSNVGQDDYIEHASCDRGNASQVALNAPLTQASNSFSANTLSSTLFSHGSHQVTNNLGKNLGVETEHKNGVHASSLSLEAVKSIKTVECGDSLNLAHGSHYNSLGNNLGNSLSNTLQDNQSELKAVLGVGAVSSLSVESAWPEYLQDKLTLAHADSFTHGNADNATHVVNAANTAIELNDAVRGVTGNTSVSATDDAVDTVENDDTGKSGDTGIDDTDDADKAIFSLFTASPKIKSHALSSALEHSLNSSPQEFTEQSQAIDWFKQKLPQHDASNVHLMAETEHKDSAALRHATEGNVFKVQLQPVPKLQVGFAPMDTLEHDMVLYGESEKAKSLRLRRALALNTSQITQAIKIAETVPSVKAAMMAQTKQPMQQTPKQVQLASALVASNLQDGEKSAAQLQKARPKGQSPCSYAACSALPRTVLQGANTQDGSLHLDSPKDSYLVTPPVAHSVSKDCSQLVSPLVSQPATNVQVMFDGETIQSLASLDSTKRSLRWFALQQRVVQYYGKHFLDLCSPNVFKQVKQHCLHNLHHLHGLQIWHKYVKLELAWTTNHTVLSAFKRGRVKEQSYKGALASTHFECHGLTPSANQGQSLSIAGSNIDLGLVKGHSSVSKSVSNSVSNSDSTSVSTTVSNSACGQTSSCTSGSTLSSHSSFGVESTLERTTDLKVGSGLNLGFKSNLNSDFVSESGFAFKSSLASKFGVDSECGLNSEANFNSETIFDSSLNAGCNSNMHSRLDLTSPAGFNLAGKFNPNLDNLDLVAAHNTALALNDNVNSGVKTDLGRGLSVKDGGALDLSTDISTGISSGMSNLARLKQLSRFPAFTDSAQQEHAHIALNSGVFAQNIVAGTSPESLITASALDVGHLAACNLSSGKVVTDKLTSAHLTQDDLVVGNFTNETLASDSFDSLAPANFALGYIAGSANSQIAMQNSAMASSPLHKDAIPVTTLAKKLSSHTVLTGAFDAGVPLNNLTALNQSQIGAALMKSPLSEHVQLSSSGTPDPICYQIFYLKHQAYVAHFMPKLHAYINMFCTKLQLGLVQAAALSYHYLSSLLNMAEHGLLQWGLKTWELVHQPNLPKLKKLTTQQEAECTLIRNLVLQIIESELKRIGEAQAQIYRGLMNLQ